MIDINDEGNVRVVTLNRPDRRNALTPTGLESIQDAVESCSAPVLYFRGAGDAFCAGADRSTVASIADDGDTEAFVRQGQQTATVIENSSSIVIVGIDGAARGGGVELALACDIRLGTSHATFGEPGVTFGLFGAWGGTVRLPEIVGLGDALDFSLSGRVLDCEEALRIGLISRIVDDPRSVADRIGENDPQALSHLKSRLRDRADPPQQESREVAAFETLVEGHSERLQEFGE